MKAVSFVLLLVVCAIDGRKIAIPLNKNANLDFINMESGGGAGPTQARQPAPLPAPAKPQTPEPKSPTGPAAPPKSPVPAPTVKPVPAAVPTIPPAIQTKPIQPSPAQPIQPKPAQPINPIPNQMGLKPVTSKPTAFGVTTPAGGSVQQLVNFYDSKGKASVIRPYTYSQAVKQG